MRSHIHGLAAVVLTVLTAAACGGGRDGREYNLQGQVLSITPGGLEANIKHEEIAGFMPAMTMPYKVREAAELAELQPGDLINATLVVVSNDAYLRDVKKVGNAPLEKAPAASSPAASGFELLQPGATVPNVTFIDQDGRTRDLESFRPSTVVMTFIYTKCPIPTFCPLMDRHFAALQKTIKADPAFANAHLVSVSFDPLTDRPPVLKKHAEGLGADPARWTFVTGDRDEIDRFAMRFGVTIVRDLDDPLDIAHNLRTLIIDSRGALVKSYTGNDWTPDQVVADLRALGT